jgi:hypothetical protein
MSTEDEEALAWAGDNDERLTSGSTSVSPVRKRRASPSSSPLSPALSDTEPLEALPAEDDQPRGLSSGEGIGLGVLGGIYLLFSAAWIVTALGDPVAFVDDPLASVMFTSGLWLAAFAPSAWFSATLFWGRHRSFFWRFGVLALGAVLVIPWPYFVRGA